VGLLALVVTAALWAVAGASAATEPTQVTIAVGPFLDNQTLPLAKEWGLDRQQGLDFKTVILPSNNAIFQALRTGDADVGAGTVAGLPPVIKQASELRNWAIKDQFLGYFIVGRKGAGPVYDTLVKQGVAPERAKRQVLGSFVGKSICIVKIQNFPVVKGALEAVGIDPGKLQVKDFADDAKAAQAFLGGSCDFYTGSLPQQAKLLRGYPDKFVAVGGYQMLGPGALWYDTWTSTSGWLGENEDTALRVLAIHYRIMRYLNEKVDWAAPAMAKLVNRASAGDLPVSEVKFLLQRFSEYLPLSKVRGYAFAPSSPYYWLKQARFVASQNAAVLPKGFRIGSWEVEPAWVAKLQARADLVKWINGPLGKPGA
jgi:ABC-type nitrate/sulfonate/bicarbonate transport system substrate-binding protein